MPGDLAKGTPGLMLWLIGLYAKVRCCQGTMHFFLNTVLVFLKLFDIHEKVLR